MQDSLFFERRVAYEVHRPPAGCSKMFFQELKVTHWLKSLNLDIYQDELGVEDHLEPLLVTDDKGM